MCIKKKQSIPNLEGMAQFTDFMRHYNTIDGYTNSAAGIIINGIEYEGLIMNPEKLKKAVNPNCVGFIKSNAVDPLNGKPLYKLYIVDGSYD